jgi:hypothetical protein
MTRTMLFVPHRILHKLRISLFAQELKTPYPISVKWAEIKPLSLVTISGYTTSRYVAKKVL